MPCTVRAIQGILNGNIFMKKKLLILTTGGTIACTAGACGYVPTLTAEKILAFVPDPPDAVLSVRAILSKDSSNITPCDWQLIARTIKDLHKEFDGIVVLHGTDTMAYSAAAVEFMTLGAPIPVIFTGAQRPIGLPDSDGAGNLCDALHAACCELLRGVFVVFDGVILNGCNVSKFDTTEDHAFDSVIGQPVGRIENGRVQVCATPRRCTDPNFFWRTALAANVLLLKITPGFDPALLDNARLRHDRVLVLEAFGLGGLPTQDGTLLEKISELRQAGILVVVTSQCSHGRCDMTIYEVGQAALRCGAICSSVISKEALFSKLMWLLPIACNASQLSSLLDRDFCGELGSAEIDRGVT